MMVCGHHQSSRWWETVNGFVVQRPKRLSVNCLEKFLGYAALQILLTLTARPSASSKLTNAPLTPWLSVPNLLENRGNKQSKASDGLQTSLPPCSDRPLGGSALLHCRILIPWLLRPFCDGWMRFSFTTSSLASSNSGYRCNPDREWISCPCSLDDDRLPKCVTMAHAWEKGGCDLAPPKQWSATCRTVAQLNQREWMFVARKAVKTQDRISFNNGPLLTYWHPAKLVTDRTFSREHPLICYGALR